MNEELNKYLEKAIGLKNAEKNIEAIELLKKAENIFGDSPKLIGLITMILYHNLEEFNKSLEYALKWTYLSPRNEKASITLVHILYNLKKHYEVDLEISRFVRTGEKLDLYNVLFEENGITKQDYS